MDLGKPVCAQAFLTVEILSLVTKNGEDHEAHEGNKKLGFNHSWVRRRSENEILRGGEILTPYPLQFLVVFCCSSWAS